MKRIAWKELGCLLLAEVLLAAMLLGGCADGNGDVLQQNGTMPTGTEAPTAPTTATTEATGAGCTVPTSEPTAPTVSVISTNPADPTAPAEPTEDTPVIGTTPTAPTTPATPKPTTPKPTEPKPTTPKPTTPKPTEPKPTTPKPTEPKPTTPKPTEPAPTEAPTEPPTEPHEYIDIEALIEYGHQYGVEQWGFRIDPDMGLHGDPVGYFPPAVVEITSMEVGKNAVREEIDALAKRLIYMEGAIWGYLEDGTEWHARLRVGIEPYIRKIDGIAVEGYYRVIAYYG